MREKKVCFDYVEMSSTSDDDWIATKTCLFKYVHYR